MRTRNLLHKTKLKEFQTFCESLGYQKEEAKGEYEVLRMRGSEGVAIIYERYGEKARGDHYTTFGLSTKLAEKFIKSK